MSFAKVFVMLVDNVLYSNHILKLCFGLSLGSFSFTHRLFQLLFVKAYPNFLLGYLSSYLIDLSLKFLNFWLVFFHFAQAQLLKEVLQHHWHTLAKECHLEVLRQIIHTFLYVFHESLHINISLRNVFIVQAFA